LFCATVAHAQQAQPTAAVPKLVRFSGSFHPANGQPTQSVESVTLAVYRDQAGGDALWHEIQNVAVDADGHYSLLMGATQNEGMPLDLFSSGESRWLGAQFNRPGETEQPRVLLVSVPYALKASDAETLGGRPASAYLLAAAPMGASMGPATSTTATTVMKPSTASSPVNSGMPKYIAMFTNTTDVGDSVMYQNNGAIGVGTTQPGISLDVRTGSLPQMGIAGTSDYLTFFASDVYGPAIYWDPAKDMRFGKGGTGLYNPFGFVEQMRIVSGNGNVGIGTQTPVAKLDVAGSINSSGDINFTRFIRYQGDPLLQVPPGTGAPFGNNIALGIGALVLNTTGVYNAATGGGALENNTTGFNNTATGYGALLTNTTGSDNTAIGNSSLYSNTTGVYNTAIGEDALDNNTSGGTNTAIGLGSLASNTTGNNNIAIGYLAGFYVSASNNDNIHIGSGGSSIDTRTIRIGDPTVHSQFFAAGVRGATTVNNDAIPVMVDSAGQLGTTSSSRRFKEDIQDMGAASYDLMRLRPVTYRYKQPFGDGSKPIQYGLIAEEVAEVYPDLVAHSADGQIETVKYQVLDSMLLNEAQRQEAEIRRLERRINEQHQEINEQRQQNQSLQERLAKLEAALASTVSVARVSGAQ
jgi:hypothetical protein